MNEAAQRPLARGEMVDVFRIEQVLGSGGFGITYLAIDTSLRAYPKTTIGSWSVKR